VVSTNNQYHFTVTEDVALVANFEEDGGVAIVETQGIASLQVYPNPTSGELIITNYELGITNAEYTIYNIVGQMVMQGVLVCRDVACNVHTINVAQLPTGMYFLKIGERTVKFVRE